MKINEIITETVKQRLDPKCWKGKHKEGTKIKGGVRVNNCVPNESVKEAANAAQQAAIAIAKKKKKGVAEGHESDAYGNTGEKHECGSCDGTGIVSYDELEKAVEYDDVCPECGGKGWVRDKKLLKKKGVEEDWNKVNHHDKTDGLSQKAVNAYRREHPGSKLKTAVTTKPSKLKPGSKDAKRRKSFCARMSGNEGPMKKPNGEPTPKALALRRWNC